MKAYHFTIVLSGTGSVDDAENRLFEAGCDDALVCTFNQTLYLEFDREAETAIEAITSAVANIQSAGFAVSSIQEGGYATASEIASMADLTKTAIANYVKGLRGGGTFPAPKYGLSSGTPLYYWPEVAEWLFEHKKIEPQVYEVAKSAAEAQVA